MKDEIKMFDWNTMSLEQMADFIYAKNLFLSSGDAKCICSIVEFYRKNKGKDQELSELTEKYEKLKGAFEGMLKEYSELVDHEFNVDIIAMKDSYLVSAGLKED